MRTISIWFLSFCFFLQLAFSQKLSEMKRFGENPGNLKMHYYQPKNLKKGSVPLMVVLHGCNQNAATIARESGFNQLADEYGFVVLYPEQRRMNNGNMCFNWFLEKDQIPNGGEAESIHNMVYCMRKNFPIDSSRIFVFGVSAGAAMTVIQGACFPETYKAIAPLAGAPYKAATGILDGMKVMLKVPDRSSDEWAKLIQDLHQSSKSYPRVTLFHGENDHVVHLESSWAIFSQWSALFKIQNKGYLQRVLEEYPFITAYYRSDESEKRVVELYIIKGIGHALPIVPDKVTGKGGKPGLFTKNIGFYLPKFLVELWEM